MEVGWDTGEVRFSGGVTVTAGANRRFTVERARFDPGTRKVIGEGGVGWQWGRFSVSAGTLVVDTVQRKFRLRGGVRLAQE
jgi:hypothetical protein